MTCTTVRPLMAASTPDADRLVFTAAADPIRHRRLQRGCRDATAGGARDRLLSRNTTPPSSRGVPAAIPTISSSISWATRRATTTCGPISPRTRASSCCTTRGCTRHAPAACSSNGDSTTIAANSTTTIRTRRCDVAEYAVEGLGGPIYYFWSMLRVVMQSARMVAVHSATRRGGPATRVSGDGDRNHRARHRTGCRRRRRTGARAKGVWHRGRGRALRRLRQDYEREAD